MPAVNVPSVPSTLALGKEIITDVCFTMSSLKSVAHDKAFCRVQLVVYRVTGGVGKRSRLQQCEEVHARLRVGKMTVPIRASKLKGG